MQTGILMTSSTGTKYWVECPDAKTGFEWMGQAGIYGPGWGHPDSVLEFGTVDGKSQFTKLEDIVTGWAPPPVEVKEGDDVPQAV